MIFHRIHGKLVAEQVDVLQPTSQEQEHQWQNPPFCTWRPNKILTSDMKDTAGKLLSSLFRLDLFIYLLKLTLSVASNFKCILYFYLIKIHGS